MVNPTERIRIIGLDFRLMHLFLIAGAGFLLFSALGIDDDGDFVRSTYNMFYLHRNFGLIWGFGIILYGLYAIARRRKTHILESIKRPIGEQVLEGFSVIGKYFFGRRISERVRTKMGRHNVMASYAFVMMGFALLLLATGGIGMIMSQQENGPYEFYLVIHVAGAALLGLFVLAHLFAVINRSNWPLLTAVFSTGRVKRSWALKAMPGYFKRTEKVRKESQQIIDVAADNQ